MSCPRSGLLVPAAAARAGGYSAAGDGIATAGAFGIAPLAYLVATWVDGAFGSAATPLEFAAGAITALALTARSIGNAPTPARSRW